MGTLEGGVLTGEPPAQVRPQFSVQEVQPTAEYLEPIDQIDQKSSAVVHLYLLSAGLDHELPSSFLSVGPTLYLSSMDLHHLLLRL